MKIRKNIFPKRLIDFLCFSVIVTFLPTIYIFEMLIVLPEFHTSNEILYYAHVLVAGFLFYNILGNMIVCMLVDTSLNSLSSEQIKSAADISNWAYCEKCQRSMPPRSWHCKICKVCILKRDHHCLFTGCCIGHKNHRYFIMFVIYLLFGSIYAFAFNSFYLWIIKSHGWFSLMKLFNPALYFISGPVMRLQNLYLIFYSLNFLAVLYSVVLSFYHLPIILRGGVSFERDKAAYRYDMGWRKNLEIVFGKRMNLVWISPIVSSDLPVNGLQWSICTDKNK